jgi:CheY-like chemotaxis protein
LAALAERRVLIVDDNHTNRRILKLQAEKWGLHARDTESPAEALEWIRRGDPCDVALLDYQMPVMDGIALARAIRELPGLRTPALILLSSIGHSLPPEHALAGFAAILAKPLRLSQLQDRLCEIVGFPDAARLPADPSPGPPASPVPLRILVAEDNAANQTVALRLLERLGYQADVAATGREALERVAASPYDVVLMDVQMPEMDGLEAARAICARWPSGERPRIIAMTAEAMEGDREACLAAGMDDYVVKPVNLDRLGRALSRCRPLAGEPPASVPPGPSGAEPAAVAVEDAVDRQALRELGEELGSGEALRQVIASFLEASPALVAALRDAAARGDAHAIREAAHTLKSSSAMLGARGLATRCAELERLGRTGTVPDAAARVEVVDALHAAVARALGIETGGRG